jgi:uncharacterized protein (DUF488 family)
LTIFTIGHSNRSADTLIALLQDACVTLLVDVRSYPGSRRWPQFNREALAPVLEAAGIRYHHAPALGGRRAGDDRSSPNGAWQEPAFRHYADYAMTPPFLAGLRAMVAMSRTSTVAMMCAEADWRQCHRRIITDYLLLDGVPVCHLAADGGRIVAAMTPEAIGQLDGTIIYPPVQPTLF